MKILIITSEVGKTAGGLALTCTQLKEILQSINHEVKVEISLDRDDYYVIDGGYDPKLGKKIKIAQSIKNIVKKYSEGFIPDLIIAYSAGKNGYITSIIAERLKKPYYVVLCGSDINLSFAEIEISMYNKIAIEKAQRIICLSNELEKNAEFFTADNNKFLVIPNGYEFKEDNLKIKKRFLEEEKIIFGTGATFLSEKKGIANLLLGFSKYIKKYSRKDKLVLYGKIDLDIKEKYERIILENSLEDSVELCGYLNREEYHKKIEKIDIYLQLSPFEGCCNAIGEAITLGKYILISNTGYFAEIIGKEYPEMIIDDIESEKLPDRLYGYLQYILENDNRDQLIEYIKKYVSLERVTKQWEELLLEDIKIVDKHIFYPKIVMFHEINNIYSGLDYPRTGFKSLVELVHKKGFRFCSYKEYMKEKEKEKLIICTFDDGYEGVYENAFPIMEKYNFTGTVFICPDLIGKSNDWNRRDEVIRYHMKDEMLMELYKKNWEIGSHGLGHYNMLRLSQTELEESLESSKERLQKKYGEILSFCYPYGSYKPYIRNLVAKYYEVAFSVDIGGCDWERDRYQLIRIVPEELKKILEKM